jgi:hypothetical protein
MLNNQQITILKHQIRETISLIQSMETRDYVHNEVLLEIYNYASALLGEEEEGDD